VTSPVTTTTSRDDGRSDVAVSLPGQMPLREGVLVRDLLGISPQVCRAPWSRLSPLVAHGLARLRVDVLLAEAGRARPELDDDDVVPTTEHLWVADGEVPVACLRTVVDTRGTPVIDRACARIDVRRLGLVSALVTDVIARRGAGRIRALALPGSVAFFARHGFEVFGPPITACAALVTPMLRHPEVPWRD
jgi:predicted GNAT family N-acyltransferase